MTPTMLRPELGTLPTRFARLPIDARGYPVPWFVQWVRAGTETPAPPGDSDAVPEFRLMDQHKWVRAVREYRCWVCGDVLGTYKVFVIGPMCGINRTTVEPPCHRNCAEWSARNCPFLTRPHMTRRNNDGLMERTIAHVAGEPILRNPGVTLLWTTKSFTIWRDPKGAPLIEIGDATAVHWIAEGRDATRAEVEPSIDSGMPFLARLAEEQDRAEPGAGAVAELARRRVVLEQLFPGGTA